MTHRRLLMGVACAALTTTALVLPATTAIGAIGPCAATVDSTKQIYALTADCDVISTLVIDDGWTLDGKQHTITAQETSGAPFPGAIISSTPGSSSAPTKLMVSKLHIDTSGFGTAPTHTGDVSGILFDGAWGAVSNVTVNGVSLGNTDHNGFGIKVDNSVGAPMGTHKVRISATTIKGFQQAGISVAGDVSFNVFRSTVKGSSSSAVASDGIVVQDLAHGGIKESAIALNQLEPATTTDYGTAIRMVDATRVEIKRNVISGTNGDIGLSVDNNSLANKIATAVVGCNLFQRAESATDPSDNLGYGAVRWVDGTFKTKIALSDSTFVGWKQDTATIDEGTSVVSAGATNSRAGVCNPKAPTTVHAGGGNHTTRVTWQPGTPLAYAPVTGYVVSAKAAGHKAITSTVGATATSTRLNGLNNKLTYKVKVRALNNSGGAAAASTLYPTKLSLGAKPARVSKGQKSVLRGKLTSQDSTVRLVGRTIVISAKPAGGKWHTISKVRTKTGGVFSKTVRTGKKTVYRASYAGKPGLASMRMTTIRVR